MRFLLPLFYLFINSTQAATVAIIDTSLDYLHDDLYKNTYINKKEMYLRFSNSKDFFESKCLYSLESYYCRYDYFSSLIRFNFENDLDKNGYIGDLIGFDFIKNDNFTPELPDYVFLRDEELKISRCSELYSFYERGIINSTDRNELSRCFDDSSLKEKYMKFFGHSHANNVGSVIINTYNKSLIYGLTFLKGYEDGSTPPDIEEIIDFLRTHKTPVANASYGLDLNYYNESVLLDNRKIYESADKTLFSVAAGNDSINFNTKVKMTIPAMINAKNTISVAAVDSQNNLASFSNYGNMFIDVAAPGVAIKGSALENRTLWMSGTSQAAPYVSGIISAIYDTCPHRFSPEIAKKIIIETCDKKSWLTDKVRCGGVVNLNAAVNTAKLLCNLKSNTISDRFIKEVAKNEISPTDNNQPPLRERDLAIEEMFNSDKFTFIKE